MIYLPMFSTKFGFAYFYSRILFRYWSIAFSKLLYDHDVSFSHTNVLWDIYVFMSLIFEMISIVSTQQSFRNLSNPWCKFIYFFQIWHQYSEDLMRNLKFDRDMARFAFIATMPILFFFNATVIFIVNAGTEYY